MAIGWRAAVVGIAGLVTARAGGGPAPGVVAFAPTGSVERVEQVRLRFATPMVAFGDPRAAAPVAGIVQRGGDRVAGSTRRTMRSICPQPLAGGRRCTYALVAGLKDAAGAAVGPRRFTFDTGRPGDPRRRFPADGNERIEEGSGLPPRAQRRADSGVGRRERQLRDRRSWRGGAARHPPRCDAGDDRRARRSRTIGCGRSSRRPVPSPPDEGEAAEPKAVVVAARCRRALPAGGRVALVWGRRRRPRPTGWRRTGRIASTSRSAPPSPRASSAAAPTPPRRARRSSR